MPESLEQLSSDDRMFAIGCALSFFICACIAVWIACLMRGEKNTKGEWAMLGMCVAIMHLFCVFMLVTLKIWSVIAIMFINASLPILGYGLIRQIHRLQMTKYDQPMPWKGLAGDSLIFLGGVGVMMLAGIF